MSYYTFGMLHESDSAFTQISVMLTQEQLSRCVVVVCDDGEVDEGTLEPLGSLQLRAFTYTREMHESDPIEMGAVRRGHLRVIRGGKSGSATASSGPAADSDPSIERETP